MNLPSRIGQRIAITIMNLGIIWFLFIEIYDRLEDNNIPTFVSIILTYFIAAYLILPHFLNLSTKILRRGRIPRFSRAADGLLADPVNIVLVGSEENLRHAFTAAGWYEADPLTVKSNWKMITSFIQNKPYLQAPFSSHYLFGRRQDHGFQKSIGRSPRKRHHIRFWAANLSPETDLMNISYWLRHHPIDPGQPLMWVGSGTKDIGLGLTRLTYKITHAVEKEVDKEREYILGSLREAGCIAKERYLHSGEFVVGKYISDGRVVVAELTMQK